MPYVYPMQYVCPMVRQAGTDRALMRNDYSNDRLTYVVSLLYYHPSQTKTETAMKDRFEICLLYEIVEKKIVAVVIN